MGKVLKKNQSAKRRAKKHGDSRLERAKRAWNLRLIWKKGGWKNHQFGYNPGDILSQMG